MAEHRPVGYTLKKRYQVLARTHFQVLGKPNHPIGASGVAGQHSIPNRSSPDFSSEHARRRNYHDARRPARSSKQQVNNSPTGKCSSRAVVFAVLRSGAKYCSGASAGDTVAPPPSTRDVDAPGDVPRRLIRV